MDCPVCGNPARPGTGRCPYCGTEIEIRDRTPAAPRFDTVNLKDDLPTVDEARRRLRDAIETARRRGTRVVKIIHGYGSSGKGGVLRTALRKTLDGWVRGGSIAGWVAGERFSRDFEEGRRLIQRFPQLKDDPDRGRSNPGITLVEIR